MPWCVLYAPNHIKYNCIDTVYTTQNFLIDKVEKKFYLLNNILINTCL